MTFEMWKAQADQPGSIVLLEGKREVLPIDAPKLRQLGAFVAQNTLHITFRSGNASGSDQYFSEGVAAIAPERLEVVTPYEGHRKTTNLAYRTYPLDAINLAAEPDVVYQSKTHRKTATLVDRFVAGAKDRFAMKAAYILRDTIKVLGAQNIPPATFAIFYDDLQNPLQGGTGHTMRICDANEVPRIDQTVWLSWLI